MRVLHHLIRLSVTARKKMKDFLLGTEEEALRNRDPLMDIVVQNPIDALWFIKVVMFCGVFVGGCISLPCVIYLSFYWQICSVCDQPLRWWLAGNCVMQLTQAPLRCLFFIQLHRTGRERNEVIRRVRVLTGSHGWSVSKFVSVLNYCWFILGVIWVFNSSKCIHAPLLWKLSVAVIIISVIRLLVTLVCFYYSFPPNLPVISSSQNRATPMNIVEQLPIVKYCSSILLHGYKENCSICLCDFEESEKVRLLSCKHNFHQSCIDRWLLKNNQCPLCLRTVTPYSIPIELQDMTT